MGISFQQTDSPAPDGNSVMCSGATISSGIPINCLIQESGTPGIVPQLTSLGGSAVERASIFFEGSPDVSDWASGNYVVRLNVTIANVDMNWVATYICRCNSSGINQATIGSLTGQSTSIGATGVKTHTVSGSSNSGNQTDRLYIVLIFIYNGEEAASFTFIPDQLIDTPIISSPGHPAIRRFSLFKHFNRNRNRNKRVA